MPKPGPATAYYDPRDPARAVLSRRPAGTILIAFGFALASPFLARFVWTRYA